MKYEDTYDSEGERTRISVKLKFEDEFKHCWKTWKSHASKYSSAVLGCGQ
jgi:hypothetical protein